MKHNVYIPPLLLCIIITQLYFGITFWLIVAFEYWGCCFLIVPFPAVVFVFIKMVLFIFELFIDDVKYKVFYLVQIDFC